MAYRPCFYTLIYTISVLTIAWPLYIYFLSQWYKQRNHFVIRNRWPIISLIIITGAIIIQLLTIIEAALCIDSISHASIGITNTLSGLVYYRSYLLYAETMKARQYLNAMDCSKPIPMIIQNDHKHYYHIWSKLILFSVLISSITVTICRYLLIDYTVYIAFSITTLIGIICLMNIVRHKVSDSIAITKECIFQITQNFGMLLLGGFTKSFIPPVIDINLWLGFIITTLYGFFSLFIAYNLIRNATNSFPFMPPNGPTLGTFRVRSESSTTDHQSTGLSVIKHTEPNATHLAQGSFSKWIDKSLLEFLNDNMEHLTLFAGYLSECFALENILFLERAIILHHIIKKYQSKDIYGALENKDNNMFCNACYRLKFNFLTQIYCDIEEMIENSIKKCDKDDDMMCKRGIVDAMKSIYRQFCCRDSDTEINVSYEIRQNLYFLFDAKSDDEILIKFKYYNDLLMVFHSAIVECWNMCESVYGFQFKTYLRRNRLQTKLKVKEKEHSLSKTDDAHPTMKTIKE